jgi:hypothetical protein
MQPKSNYLDDKEVLTSLLPSTERRDDAPMQPITAKATSGPSMIETERPKGYKVVFRKGRDTSVLYWNDSLAEIQQLARRLALECGADGFEIVEFASDAKPPNFEPEPDPDA